MSCRLGPTFQQFFSILSGRTINTLLYFCGRFHRMHQEWEILCAHDLIVYLFSKLFMLYLIFFDYLMNTTFLLLNGRLIKRTLVFVDIHQATNSTLKLHSAIFRRILLTLYLVYIELGRIILHDNCFFF